MILLPCFSHVPPLYHPSDQALADILQLFWANVVSPKLLEGWGRETSFPYVSPQRFKATSHSFAPTWH